MGACRVSQWRLLGGAEAIANWRLPTAMRSRPSARQSSAKEDLPDIAYGHVARPAARLARGMMEGRRARRSGCSAGLRF